MTTTSKSTSWMFVATLAAVASSAAVAQGGTVQLSPQNTYAGPATTTVDMKIKSAYKKTTYMGHVKAFSGTGATREIPPTDCPPLPPKDCLDTWDDELTAKP